MESHLHRYLTEEVAFDHAEGLLTRREALRRLALMGLTPVTASALLAACGGTGGGGGGGAGQPTTPGKVADTVGPSTRPSPEGVENIAYLGPGGARLQAAWAPSQARRGGMLVIHENRGLTDHIRSVAARLSRDGYSSLAVDLLSREGGTQSLGDQAAASAALSKAPQDRFVTDLRASVDELTRRLPNQKIGVIGFCFGGGLTWSLLNAGEPRLAAAIPFYGPTPPNPDFSRSRAAVLGVYAELDQRVNATRETAEAALRRAGLPYEIRTFPGVDHAFFNDTGQRYNAQQATQAYQAVLTWLGRYVAA